ncbi:hypothetical protein F511_42632 [Dorcoceras hygrometricum]|uniref:CCHC-type domain-containing protein n=1 Tax=Dorcoceras hygrometricum TaxID=472368 RepID=A0A2Z7AM99_9LAMI|nr:hypothetical protein F511_42632 [Dorcoceras hygrometricum]
MTCGISSQRSVRREVNKLIDGLVCPSNRVVWMSVDGPMFPSNKNKRRIAQLLECLVEQSIRRSELCSSQGSNKENPQKEFRRKRKRQVSPIKKQKSLDQLPQPSNPNPRMNTKPICPSCRKNHYGQCRFGQDGCYRCGTLGHIAKFCPKLNQPTTGKESVMASDPETSVTIEIPGTTHLSVSHNVALNQVINKSVNQAQDVLQVYVGINNKVKGQNREELLPRSSKPTNEQPDQISQESSNEQQLCASSSIRSTASNKISYTETSSCSQQKSAATNRRCIRKRTSNDAASTNQNDAVALQYLTTYFFPNNQQLVALNNSNDIVKDTSPLLPTADRKRYTQNAAFQLIKTTSPLISDWFLKPTAGHSAGTIPHNATADSATTE